MNKRILFRFNLVCPNREKSRGLERELHDMIRMTTSLPVLVVAAGRMFRTCGKCGAQLEAR